MSRPRRIAGALAAVCLLLASSVSAATVCVNRFLARSEGGRQVVTLLTGKMTFQEAQLLVTSNKASAIEWVDDKGKLMAKASVVKAVRPMPVGCDGRTSGVVLIATFPYGQRPAEKMYVKLDSATATEFTQQKE